MKKRELYKITDAIKSIRNTATDENALNAIWAYPEWNGDVLYEVGARVRDGDGLYKRRQPQSSPEIYRPNEAPALWEHLTTESGTHDNPIHYAVGMALEKDKYYTEDGVLYICTRDTGVPVYNPLSALVGIYVELTV